ncbi:hypothetical protein SKAU_G00160580 [Synaphobranchus kaupii]|uniref:Uncharacterized protein n=1 Tax=Synaphobranchus kaupii TaxID=118154 RepID=A0A9Q1FIL7_SYNKA|nr:hypothetical protein SKAU_G00160580 [Synaphobranchus kaupii]
MSQAGKILHLYVEVRSVPEEEEEEGKGPVEVQGIDPPALPGDKVLMECRPATALEPARRRDSGGPGVSPAKSAPRHPAQRPAHHRQSLPCEGIGQLLSVLQPGLDGRGGDTRPHPSECEAVPGRGSRSSTPPGRTTAPPTPTGGRRAPVGHGRRSVVTFSYIEKSSIKPVDGAGPQNPFSQALQESPEPVPNHYRKRLSDPVWLNSADSSRSSSPKLCCPSPGPPQMGSPNLRRATLDSIARAATQRALEDFGSPQVHRKATNGSDGLAVLHHPEPRCQSWAGSPVLSRSACTLPNTRLMEPDRNRASSGLPRSPASDHLSAHARPSAQPGSPSSRARVNFNLGGGTPYRPGDSMNQLSSRKSASPANSPEVARRLAEEASKLSSLFMEARTSPSPTPSADTARSESPRMGYLSRDAPSLSPSPGRGSPVPPHALMNIPVPPHPPGSASPALPARLFRAGPHPDDPNPSPIRDPRQQRAELPQADSPTPHRHQPPQYTGGSRSPSLERRHEPRYERGARDSPEAGRRFYMGPYGGVLGTEAPDDRYVGGASPVTLSKWAEQQRREVALLGPVALELQQEAPSYVEGVVHLEGDQSGAQGSSQSSSGVTGSLTDGSQMDRDCISPESSQSSQKSSDTGQATSGIQSDSGSSLGPSLHSQRIARAKWEFLFGSPSEDDANLATKDFPDASTAPPSGTSSESPTPTPPSSLPLELLGQEEGRREAGQSLASHNVQHVEVDLMTPPPAAVGASPKTGIIRRTIKYSETDLDAVPLRCYRETNIDEVLAEQEDADSAFGSNRSVMGTSGTGSSPPGGRALRPH